MSKLKNIRPLEKSYLEAIKQRDNHEKKSFQHIYEDFVKYNQEIKRVTHRHNELLARMNSAGGAVAGSGKIDVESQKELVDLRKQVQELKLENSDLQQKCKYQNDQLAQQILKNQHLEEKYNDQLSQYVDLEENYHAEKTKSEVISQMLALNDKEMEHLKEELKMRDKQMLSPIELVKKEPINSLGGPNIDRQISMNLPRDRNLIKMEQQQKHHSNYDKNFHKPKPARDHDTVVEDHENSFDESSTFSQSPANVNSLFTQELEESKYHKRDAQMKRKTIYKVQQRESLGESEDIPEFLVHSIQAHKRSKWSCIQFNAPGTIIATGGQDKSVKLWNVNKGYVTSKFDSLSSAVSVLKYSMDLLGVGQEDGKFKILSTEPGLKIFVDLPHLHKQAVTCIEFFSNNNKVITGSLDCTIKIWELKSGLNPMELITVSPCTSLALSPDNTQLLTGHQDSVLRVYNVSQDGQETKILHDIVFDKSAMTSIVFSKLSHNTIIINTKDSRIIMIDTKTFKPFKNFEELDNYIYPSHKYPVQACFSRTEQLVVVPSNQSDIAFFEVQDPSVVYVKEHPKYELGILFCMVQWHHITGKLAAIDNKGMLFIWSSSQ